MDKKIIFITILIAGIRFSCIANSYIVGEYQYGLDRFIFNEDFTFTYESKIDGYEYSTGSWKIMGNEIILDSDIKDLTIPIDVIYQTTEELRAVSPLHIIVNANENKNAQYRCMPYINGIPSIFEVPLDSYSGNVSFSPIKNIYFEIWKVNNEFTLNYTQFPVKTETKNIESYFNGDIYIYININDSLFGYKVFDNIKLKYKNEKIIFKERGNKSRIYHRLE